MLAAFSKLPFFEWFSGGFASTLGGGLRCAARWLVGDSCVVASYLRAYGCEDSGVPKLTLGSQRKRLPSLALLVDACPHYVRSTSSTSKFNR
jgi:hypothetical protein